MIYYLILTLIDSKLFKDIFSLIIGVAILVLLSLFCIFIHDMWGTIPRYTAHTLAEKKWYGIKFRNRLIRVTSYLVTVGLCLSLVFSDINSYLKNIAIVIPVLMTLEKEYQSGFNRYKGYKNNPPKYSKHIRGRIKWHDIWLSMLYIFLGIVTVLIYFMAV